MRRDIRPIVGKLNYLHLLYRIHIHREISQCGLYMGQHPILEFVLEHDGCTQVQVAQMMHVSPPSIATSVKRMQRAGLLEKTADETDQRRNRLSVTEKGKQTALQCRKKFDGVDRLLFQGFTPDECQQLSEYLDRLVGNLTTEELENHSVFSLIEQEKKLHVQQSKKSNGIKSRGEMKMES